VPGGFQSPSVDDIADKVDGVGIVTTEEVEKAVGLRTAGSEVNIGDKQGAKASFGTAIADSLSFHARAFIKNP
jgi:hypothetical protein